MSEPPQSQSIIPEQAQADDIPFSDPKIEQLQELLQIYKLQLNYEESCVGKLFRFERTPTAAEFERQHSVPRILSIRIDDLVYLALLLIVTTFFTVYNYLQLSSSGSSLVQAYRQFAIMGFICSSVWLLTSHWFSRLALVFFYLLLPVGVVLAYLRLSTQQVIQILPLDPVDQNNTYMQWISYLALPAALLKMPLIYPLKQYIRNQIGAIYSYLYALGVHFLLILWPLHSLFSDLATTGQVSTSFFKNNLPIMYSIYGVMLCFLYMYIDEKLFSPGHQEFKKELIEAGLTQQQIREFDLPPNSFLIRNYKWFEKTLSASIFVMFLGLEVYFMTNLITKLSAGSYTSVLSIVLTMAYIPLFLLIGCWIINSTFSNSWTFVLISVASLLPSALYPILYVSGSSLNLVLLAGGPFTMIFWMFLKSLNKNSRILFLGTLAYCFVFFFTPALIITLNKFQVFTSDPQKTQQIDYAVEGVTGCGFLIVLLYQLVKVVRFAIEFVTENQKIQTIDQTIDYDYEEQQCKYVPYRITKTLSLQALTLLDLTKVGYLVNAILFIGCESLNIYCLNALLNIYTSPNYFYSSSIRYVVYSAFAGNFVMLIFAQYLITADTFTEQVPNSFVFIILSMLSGSIALVSCSFIFTDSNLQLVFRLLSVFLFVILLLVVGVTLLKNNNSHISKFLGPVSAILLWLVFVMPFLNIVPAISIFIDQSKFGDFLYNIILVASIIVIGVVFMVTLIFNAILNRFEEEKKTKSITTQLKNFLNESGVQAEDQSLYRFYQSFQYRDKKYLFYLKHGYPVRLDQNDADYTELITIQEAADRTSKRKQESLRKLASTVIKTPESEQPQKYQYPCCMSFLGCLFGDEELFEEKVQEVVSQNQMNQDAMEDLLPLLVLSAISKKRVLNPRKPKIVDNRKKNELVSTRTIELRGITVSKRRIYSDFNQRINRERKLRIECLHHIFDFFSNQDHSINRVVIYADLKILIQLSKVQVEETLVSTCYDKYAKTEWGEIMALDVQGFALTWYQISDNIIEEGPFQSKLEGLLAEVMIPNLSQFVEFREMLDGYYKFLKHEYVDTQDSPFMKLAELKKEVEEKDKFSKEKYEQRKQQQRIAKVVKQQAQEKEPEEDQKSKVSCRLKTKTSIYKCWASAMDCLYDVVAYVPLRIKKLFTKKSEEEGRVMKMRVKSWEYISVESTKILQKAERQYINKNSSSENQYVFRQTFNNYFPAAMKVLDLYYFLSLTFSDQNIPWFGSSPDINPNNGGFLYNNYVIVFWSCVGLTIIYAGMSFKAVTYIAEGRFGTTEFGAPAHFPHPMFFFTTIYKAISTSLFSIIMTTIYDTFDCTWIQSTNNTFYLYRDTSIQCLSGLHSVYMVMAVVAMAVYYPISAYASPNFQFMEKSLDLKYKPSFLVLSFQSKFVLVVANVLLTSVSSAQNRNLQIVYISIILAALTVLVFVILTTRPCLIEWFNFVDLAILLIALTFNGAGLVLYLTNQALYCWIAGGVGSAVILIVTGVYLKKVYFANTTVHEDELSENQELVEALKANQKRIRNAANFGTSGQKLEVIDLNNNHTQLQ